MRLPGFDYSRPLFFMVTLKCLPTRQPLSAIVAPGRCEMNATTRAMVNCIRTFHNACTAIEPIECFSIMPDHVHMLVKIKDRYSGAKLLGESGDTSPKSLAPILRLETIVSLLMQALEGRYAETTGSREQVFAADWHDWIVMAKGQLPTFTRYIRENPKRHWLRHHNRHYFTQVGHISLGGREWFAYGNPAAEGASGAISDAGLSRWCPFMAARTMPKARSSTSPAMRHQTAQRSRPRFPTPFTTSQSPRPTTTMAGTTWISSQIT